MLRNDLQTQGNAGPHSFVGLLFSFQRPSLTPRPEDPAFESSPDRRGVAKTTVLRQGGSAVTTSAGPLRQEESSRPASRTSSRCEAVTSISTRLARQAFPASAVFAGSARGVLLVPPRRRPRQGDGPGISKPSSLAHPRRGRVLYPGGRTVSRGRGALERPDRSPSPIHLISSSFWQLGRGRATSLALSPPGGRHAQRGLAQSPVSTSPRLHRAAAALSARSAGAPRRDRSWRAIASSRAWAASRTSFTTT